MLVIFIINKDIYENSPYLRRTIKRAKICNIMTRVAKSTSKEVSVEESDTNDLESRVYELGFHIDPDLSKQKVKELFQVIKDSIGKVGTVIAVGEPHRLHLAYTISRMEREGRHDFSSAFFGWIAYQANTEGHEQVIEMVKEHDDVFRHIDICTTKDIVEHAAIQHEEWYRHAQKEDGRAEMNIEKSQVQTQESKEKLDVAIENAVT